MNPTHQFSRKVRRPLTRPGFTLVELLLVVAILGILAAIVVPQFVSATSQSAQNSVQMDLSRIRMQIQVYQQQHDGNWPTLANFESQMTLASKGDGTTSAPGTSGYPFGPYIQQVPVNPLSGGNTVSAGAVGSSDWFYNETTGDFHANDSALSYTY